VGAGESSSARRRRRWQQRTYAWSPEEQARLLRAQRGRCLACRDLLGLGRGGMVTDHDHSPSLLRIRGKRRTYDGGPIRGILCTRCNSVLGRVKDNPMILLWLARYAIATDAADEWVPTKLPLIHELSFSYAPLSAKGSGTARTLSRSRPRRPTYRQPSRT
jgi:hypothetical protein